MLNTQEFDGFSIKYIKHVKPYSLAVTLVLFNDEETQEMTVQVTVELTDTLDTIIQKIKEAISLQFTLQSIMQALTEIELQQIWFDYEGVFNEGTYLESKE